MSDDVVLVPGDTRVIIVPDSTSSVIVKQGESGPSGTPGLVWRGGWSASSAYVTNDVVFYFGSSWVASQPVSAGTAPPTSGTGTSSYWELLARGSNINVTVSHDAPPGPMIDDIWIQV